MNHCYSTVRFRTVFGLLTAIGLALPTMARAADKRLPTQMFRNACIGVGCQKFSRRGYKGDFNTFKITDVAWKPGNKGLNVKVQSNATLGLSQGINPGAGDWFSFHVFDHRYVATDSGGLKWPHSYQILRAADDQKVSDPMVTDTVGIIYDPALLMKHKGGSIDQQLANVVSALPSQAQRQLNTLNGKLVRTHSKLTFENPELLPEKNFLGRGPLQDGVIKRSIKLLDGTTVWLVSHADDLPLSGYLTGELSTVKSKR